MGVFKPAYGSTISISVSETASPPNALTALAQGESEVLVTNNHDQIVYVKLGGSDVEAENTDLPIMPDRQQLVNRARGEDYISVITETGTGAILVTCGKGF